MNGQVDKAEVFPNSWDLVRGGRRFILRLQELWLRGRIIMGRIGRLMVWLELHKRKENEKKNTKETKEETPTMIRLAQLIEKV